ncbi:MAG: hypothetical protein IPJ77_22365 [Planctomycetes bacterium]|nr:hypothetical protein [Planctomycetota bacterium]
MNTINHAVSAVFDALLYPLELLGRPAALILVSAVFGVLALLLFKRISWQKGIRAAKDKIWAGMIEIRIYQDDLRVASKAIVKVLARNFVYLGLNFLPFVPLSVPFAFVVAQCVVRYGFAPVEVRATTEHVSPGSGTLLSIELESAHGELARGLAIEYPPGVEPISPLVRAHGRAFQEVVARAPGAHAIAITLPNGARETKFLVAGTPERRMQGERGKGFLDALLWPAEDALDASSPFARIAFTYPDSRLGWFPGGAGGVLLVFLVASMLAGALAIKPLKVQI